MQTLIIVFCGLFGLVIGSFLNVLIYRVPLRLSVAKGRSFCPSCQHILRWSDLVPVVSYLFLCGRCRYCKAKISMRYPVVELLNALCYAGLYWVYGPSLYTLVNAIGCSCLLVLAGINLDHGILPDRFHLIIGAGGIVLMIFGNDLPWWNRLIGLVAVSVPLLIVALLTQGMGEGDIKLFAVCGLLLGWQRVLLSLFLAAILGVLISLPLILRKKLTGKSAVPFGPFIALSVILTIFFGDPLLHAYLSLLHLG